MSAAPLAGGRLVGSLSRGAQNGPMLSTLVTVLLFGEPHTELGLAGLALIVAGIGLSAMENSDHPASH